MRTLLLVACLALTGCVNVPGPGPGEGDAIAAGYALVCDVARGGAAWTEPCLAFASPNDSPSKAEIDIAVNPVDPENVVVSSKDLDPKASKCVWAIPQVSKDGGRGWTTVYIGGEKDARQPTEPLWGWNCITDPIMAFDAEGTLYYSLQAYDHTLEGSDNPLPGLPVAGKPLGTFGSAIFAARSPDGGLTWDKIVTLHAGDGANIFHDYMRVLVNPATGTYHTIWNQFTGVAVVPVLVAWDGVSDRAAPPVYLPVPESPAGSTMAGFAAASDGTLYALLDAGPDAYLATSTDDGRTFSTPTKIDALTRESPIRRQALGEDAFRTTGSYELAVDKSGGARDGWVYATISDCPRDDCDVFVSRSEDGGATWSERVLVNHGAHQPGTQWIPRPYVDRLGNLHLVYFDTSRDLATNFIDATWGVSTDGGATWTNTLLTATPFDGNLGVHQDDFPFIGDYNGIAGAGDHVYMGFPTTVTGRAEIAVAKVALPSS